MSDITSLRTYPWLFGESVLEQKNFRYTNSFFTASATVNETLWWPTYTLFFFAISYWKLMMLMMESRSLTMLLPNYNKTQRSEELSWCQPVQTSWLWWNCVSLFLDGCDLSLALLRSLKSLAHLWGDDQIPSF